MKGRKRIVRHGTYRLRRRNERGEWVDMGLVNYTYTDWNDSDTHSRDAACDGADLEYELQLREAECEMFEEWVDTASEIGG